MILTQSEPCIVDCIPHETNVGDQETSSIAWITFSVLNEIQDLKDFFATTYLFVTLKQGKRL